MVENALGLFTLFANLLGQVGTPTHGPIGSLSDIETRFKSGEIQSFDQLLRSLPNETKNGAAFVHSGEGLIPASREEPVMVVASSIQHLADREELRSLEDAKKLELLLFAFNPLKMTTTQRVVDVMSWNVSKQNVDLAQIHLGEKMKIISIETNPTRCLSCHQDATGRIRPIWGSYPIGKNPIEGNIDVAGWIGTYQDLSKSSSVDLAQFPEFRKTLIARNPRIANQIRWLNGINMSTATGMSGMMSLASSLHVGNVAGFINALTQVKWLENTYKSSSRALRNEIRGGLREWLDSTCLTSGYETNEKCKHFLSQHPDFNESCQLVENKRIEFLRNTALREAAILESSPYQEDLEIARQFRTKKVQDQFIYTNDYEDQEYGVTRYPGLNPKQLYCALRWVADKTNQKGIVLGPSLQEGFYFNNASWAAWNKVLLMGIDEVMSDILSLASP